MEKLQRHFQDQLDLLAEKVLVMGGLVEETIGTVMSALVNRDSELARQVIRDDEKVDRLDLEIDQIGMEILGLHQPVARDLRFVITAMKITNDLERIADLCTNVAERAIELNDEQQLKPFIDIPLMARRAQQMVRGALDAFVQRDPAAARAVIAMDDELDDRMEQVFRELLSFMIEDPKTTTRALRLMFVAKYFERMGDQSTNIGEQIVFMAEGRVIKHPGDHRGRRDPRILMKRILVIEDDPDIALSLRHTLERAGEFSIEVAADGAEGLRLALDRPPDLILLDVNLPGMDGFEVCRQLRKDPATETTPVIMLTARIGESDRVLGLDLGADDYITKPFSPKEALARVRAVLRRSDRKTSSPEILADGPIRIDVAGRRAEVAGRELSLTRKEFDLLVELMRQRGRVLTRERLLETVWGYDYPGETRTVDVHVRRLRQKLGATVDDRVETVVGVGYRYRSGV